MATKKKAAKTAKKTSTLKKGSVKKSHTKTSRPNNSKTAKPAGKKPIKSVVNKSIVKKVATKKIAKPAKKSPLVKTLGKKTEVKKTVTPVRIDKKPEIKTLSLPPHPPKKPVVPTKPVKVVIPEMKTKTVRKYEPDFTKSVLDQPENVQTGPIMKYSDAELAEFRELIQKKLEQAKKELAYLQGLITRKDEMGGDENENRYMTMEDGSMSMEREQLAQMASRQINYIDHLEKAMVRIENKTYGICRVTGKLIDKARLRAVPHATLSIEAKQTMNK